MTLPSMIDRPFGCPPDKPRCSCGAFTKTVATVQDKPLCGKCWRKLLRKIDSPFGRKTSKYGVDMSQAGKLDRTRIINGHPFVFDSKGEAGRYDQLKLLEQTGYIRNLELQPKYKIEIKGKHICYVVLDFRYFEGTTRQVEDFKGKDTPLSRLKRRLVEASCPGTKIKIVK